MCLYPPFSVEMSVMNLLQHVTGPIPLETKKHRNSEALINESVSQVVEELVDIVSSLVHNGGILSSIYYVLLF